VSARLGLREEEMPASRQCRMISGYMLDYLRGADPKTPFEVETRYGWEVDEHRYIKSSISDVIADPTWKQFIPESMRGNALPDILIGDRDYIAHFAGSFGVSEANQLLWLPVRDRIQPERPVCVAERIAAAFDESY